MFLCLIYGSFEMGCVLLLYLINKQTQRIDPFPPSPFRCRSIACTSPPSSVFLIFIPNPVRCRQPLIRLRSKAHLVCPPLRIDSISNYITSLHAICYDPYPYSPQQKLSRLNTYHTTRGLNVLYYIPPTCSLFPASNVLLLLLGFSP